MPIKRPLEIYCGSASKKFSTIIIAAVLIFFVILNRLSRLEYIFN